MYFKWCKITAVDVLIIFCVFKVARCEDADLGKSDQLPLKREKCGTVSQCTGKQTVFERTSAFYNCYCDNACYETFQDCCPDFVQTCGEQKRTLRKNSQLPWKCVELDRSKLGQDGCFMKKPVGIWMITNCPDSWGSGTIKEKCENASQNFSYPVENFLPVVSEDRLTYRNEFCAWCNGEQIYQSWDIVVQSLTEIPPYWYDINEKIRFAFRHKGKVKNILPGNKLPRRYCVGAKYKDSCSNKSHPNYTNCNDGPVQTVGNPTQGYFKNSACAICNGQYIISAKKTPRQNCTGLELDPPPLPQQVFSFGTPGGSQGAISDVYKGPYNNELTVVELIKNHCPIEQVYDENFQYCRKALATNTNDTLSDVFLIILTFEEDAVEFQKGSKVPIRNIKNITEHMKTALLKKFALKSRQVAALKLHRQNFIVLTFRLTLTPYQKLILANQNTSNLNVSAKSQKFLKLLKFTSFFTMTSGKYGFHVAELISKQLACYKGQMLQQNEYEIDKISGNVFVNKSGKTFLRNEYKILGKIGGNITLCRKFLPTGCHKGAFVTLNETEFFMYKNLSIFHYATNKTFNFGDYLIIDDDTGLKSFKNTSFPKNSTISVCLPFRRTFNTTVKVVTKSDKNDPGMIMEILTLVGFSVSIMFLLFLLVTYGIFKELRTLPGLNLMSLAISMLLSHLIWLIGTTIFKNTKTCQVLGIIEHYLFLVTFMAMSVISYHSCVVFSKPFNRNSKKSPSKFAKYSTISWLIPAIFIAVCISLDQTETTFDIYDNRCWLSTDKAVLYLFLLPSALLLLYNICTFIKTALALSCFNKDVVILQRDRKQNVIVCTKLASMVGFPWVFAFFGVIFPGIEVFEYLFVVFACLQGFYISVAFVCNKKTLRLYKKWWKNQKKKKVSAHPRNQTFQMS